MRPVGQQGVKDTQSPPQQQGTNFLQSAATLGNLFYSIKTNSYVELSSLDYFCS
jgi:hypothetical protein